jgi:hypothetical protein
MKMAQQNAPRAPDHEIRVGFIRASIWLNESEEGQRAGGASTKIEKRYRDENGEFKTTTYFFPNDLPRLALVAQKVFEFIALRESEAVGFPPI